MHPRVPHSQQGLALLSPPAALAHPGMRSIVLLFYFTKSAENRSKTTKKKVSFLLTGLTQLTKASHRSTKISTRQQKKWSSFLFTASWHRYLLSTDFIPTIHSLKLQELFHLYHWKIESILWHERCIMPTAAKTLQKSLSKA